MKTEWVCTWSLFPGSKKHVEKYSSERKAKTAMAQRIAEHFDLKPYLDKMRKENDPDYTEAADYLEKFLSCLMFSECAEESLPSMEGRVEIYSDGEEFSWSYNGQYFPYLSARESCFDEEPGLFVGCCFQRVPKSKVNQAKSINIHVVERKNYGTSAYPLMVLYSLREKPATQGQIARTILETWDADINRKAVGRHLRLLENLGFPVQKCAEGYYRDGEKREPRTDLPYTPCAYPLLILYVLDGTPKTQAAIIQAVQERFGAKIDRKAVGRHLVLLKALGVHVEKCEDGYYIGQ